MIAFLRHSLPSVISGLIRARTQDFAIDCFQDSCRTSHFTHCVFNLRVYIILNKNNVLISVFGVGIECIPHCMMQSAQVASGVCIFMACQYS